MSNNTLHYANEVQRTPSNQRYTYDEQYQRQNQNENRQVGRMSNRQYHNDVRYEQRRRSSSVDRRSRRRSSDDDDPYSREDDYARDDYRVDYRDDYRDDYRVDYRRDYEYRGRYQDSRRQDRRENESNPAMTVWRETYELWDGVLETVGKAWYKMGGK